EMAAAVEQIENMKKEKKPSIAKPAENKEQTTQYIGNPFDQNKATIQQATFSDFDQVELNSNEQKNLDMLLDITLNIKVELGRTKGTIKDILELSSGSLIELVNLAGEPVDILVAERLIGTGDRAVIDDDVDVP